MPHILQNDMGKYTTHSTVSFKAQTGKVLVGLAAENNRVRNPENTFYDVKRLIGRGFDERQIQEDLGLWPFKVVEGPNKRPMLEVTKKDGIKQKLYPEQISAKVLEKMKYFAEKNINGVVKNAVVTVPAYFNDSQKQATKDACYMAGLVCKQIVNEPTAAAIAYGFEKSHGDTEKLCVVFDFGGGTLDISVLSIQQQRIIVKAVNGNTHLGGQDIDNCLMNYCI